MKNASLVVAAAALVALASATGVSARTSAGVWQDATVLTLREGVAWQRSQAWRWQEMAGVRRSPTAYAERRERSIPYLRWAVRLWNGRRDAAYRAYKRGFSGLPPHYSAWLCIHRYEGAWNDPDAPYYGGLQMDIGFQKSYGARLLATKGTADHWTPLEQMWVAEKAFSSGRGFYPWPNTARYCGLI